MPTRYHLVVSFVAQAACADLSMDHPLGLDVAISGSVVVAQGRNAATSVLVTRRDGYSDAVPLEASDLPSGVTAAFDPPYIVAGTGDASSRLTLSAAADAATGTFQYTVTARSSSSRHPSATGSITVIAASSRVDPLESMRSDQVREVAAEAAQRLARSRTCPIGRISCG